MNNHIEFIVSNEDEVMKIKQKHNLKLGWNIVDDPMKIEINGKLVGLLDYELDEMFGDNGILIHNFEIIEKGIGIGSEVIKFFIQEEKGYRIYLYPEDERSTSFWQRHGFLPEDDGTGTIIYMQNN